jgi:hypothetical protein
MLGVTRQNLQYQWRKYLAGQYDDSGIIGLDICFPSHTSASDVSPLTAPEECITAPIERPNKNIMMKRALEQENALKYNLTTLASERFQEKRDEARANGKDVGKKCLRNILQEIEAEHDLPENTLNYETIRKFKLTAGSVTRNSFCVNSMDLDHQTNSLLTKLHLRHA